MIRFISILFIACLFMGCTKEDIQTVLDSKAANKLSVGKSAGELLSDNKFKSLQIEIAYMPGLAPDNGAINNLKSFLQTILNKPSGITISQRQIAASGMSTYTAENLRKIEDDFRQTYNSTSNISVFVLYVDGQFSNANTLGVAYRNTSFAIFGQVIINNSGGINQVSKTKLETTVLEHEAGHLLGLVNLGSPMVTNHQDGNNASHCNNQNCLMYFLTESNMMAGILFNSPVPTLDANCLNDLKANGGK